MAKLNVAKVRNAKPQSRPYKLADGHGLYFHVATSGKMTWRYRYRIGGKESTFTLGEYPQMSLGEARAQRVHARELVKAGIDPVARRHEERAAQIAEETSLRGAHKTSFEFVARDLLLPVPLYF